MSSYVGVALEAGVHRAKTSVGDRRDDGARQRVELRKERDDGAIDIPPHKMHLRFSQGDFKDDVDKFTKAAQEIFGQTTRVSVKQLTEENGLQRSSLTAFVEPNEAFAQEKMWHY